MIKDWLTFHDIVEKLEGRLSIGSLEQFHHNTVARELLGAAGSDYPSWSLRYWRVIADAHEHEGLRPEDVGGFLRELMDRESGPDEEEEATADMLSPLPVPGENVMSRETVEAFAEALADALVRHARHAGFVPLREDRLIGKEEAARLLNCTPQAVARRVRPLQPGSWSYIQIQEYLAHLRESAK